MKGAVAASARRTAKRNSPPDPVRSVRQPAGPPGPSGPQAWAAAAYREGLARPLGGGGGGGVAAAGVSPADSAMATARAHSGCSGLGRVAVGARAGGSGGGWVRRMLTVLVLGRSSSIERPANRTLMGRGVRPGPGGEACWRRPGGGVGGGGGGGGGGRR